MVILTSVLLVSFLSLQSSLKSEVQEEQVPSASVEISAKQLLSLCVSSDCETRVYSSPGACCSDKGSLTSSQLCELLSGQLLLSTSPYCVFVWS